MELRGVTLFRVDTRGMMQFDNFALLFTFVAALSTFVFFLLSSKDMERVGVHYSDYFALLFFVLVGVALVAALQVLINPVPRHRDHFHSLIYPGGFRQAQS
jgi:NADH-quinone oxidoreductase subunit N